MTTVVHLKDAIMRQMQFNDNKNLFSTSPVPFHFTAEMQMLLSQLRLHSKLSSAQQEELLAFLVTSCEQQFYRSNQYTHFQFSDLLQMRNVYREVLREVLSMKLSISELEQHHYLRLRQFLQHTNPALVILNTNASYYAKQPACSEYSAAFQIQLLQLDLVSLKEPILDIGCGEHGYLVQYLRSIGKEAYGIDRMPASLPYISKANWLEYSYQEQHWGTVLSNLAFSSHFIAHEQDDIAMMYAKTYKAILDSLQNGGSFLYAPSLPMLEQYLPKDQYQVRYKAIQDKFYASVITKKLHKGIPIS